MGTGARQMANALKRAREITIGVSLLAGAGALGGCAGGDGVELNGKIFEAIGIAGDPFAKRAEPKTQARAPLVLPPDSTKLPEPGSQPTAGAPITTGSVDSAWPRDRDAIKAADADAQRRAKEQACKDNWKERANRQSGEPDAACSGSIFSVLGDQLFGSSDK